MTTPAAVSKSYTAVGSSDTLIVKRGQDVTLAISGTYAGTIRLMKALGSGEGAWVPVLGPYSTANATVSALYTPRDPEERLRTECSVFTSGTIVTSITPATLEGLVLRDPGAGAAVLKVTEQGIELPLGVLHSSLVAAGATLTLDPKLHAGRTILLDTAAGSIVTLPAATGSGARFRFQVSVTATSNSHVVKVTGDDIMQGVMFAMSDAAGGAVVAWETAADSDTITLNRTTTGTAKIGHYIEVEDIKADTWAVHGLIAQNGAEATPFSAAV